jgi:hypothetical protein
MKRIALAISALALAPSAGAQSDALGCERFRTLVADAPAGLTAHRGEPMPGMSGMFRSTFTPRGFDQCVIGTGDTTSLICMSKPLTERGAGLLLGMEMALLRTCLAGWEARTPKPFFPMPSPAPGQPEPVLEQSNGFAKIIAGADVSFSVLVARMDAPADAPRLVAFGFRWTPANPLGS